MILRFSLILLLLTCSMSQAVMCIEFTNKESSSWELGGRIEVDLKNLELDTYQEHGGEYVIYIQRGSDTVIAGVQFSRSAIKSVIQTALKNQDFKSLTVSGVWVERTSYAFMLEIDHIEDAPVQSLMPLLPAENGQFEFGF